MNTKTILPIILGIFLLANVSALSIYGTWEDGSKDMKITFGQSVEFDAEFFTMDAPMEISIIMYSLDNENFEKEFETKTIIKDGAYNTWYTINTNVYSEPGNYEIVLSASDRMIKGGISETLTLKIVPAGEDVTKPVIEIFAPEEGKTYNSVESLHYKITDENLKTCEYSTDNGETKEIFECESGVERTIEINAKNGENTWTIYAEDEFGNENSESVTFTVDPDAEDTTAPSITIVRPKEDKEYNKDHIEFKIISDEELERAWFVLDSEEEIDMENTYDNVFIYDVKDLSEGRHTVTFYAKDLAGNEAEKTIDFRIDTTDDSDDDESENDDYYDNEYQNQFDDPNVINLGDEEPSSENNKKISSLWVWILIIAIIIVVIIIILLRLAM